MTWVSAPLAAAWESYSSIKDLNSPRGRIVLFSELGWAHLKRLGDVDASQRRGPGWRLHFRGEKSGISCPLEHRAWKELFLKLWGPLWRTPQGQSAPSHWTPSLQGRGTRQVLPRSSQQNGGGKGCLFTIYQNRKLPRRGGGNLLTHLKSRSLGRTSLTYHQRGGASSCDVKIQSLGKSKNQSKQCARKTRATHSRMITYRKHTK